MTRKINLTENDIRKMVENVILEYGGFGHADWAAENGKQRQPQQTKHLNSPNPEKAALKTLALKTTLVAV